MDEVNVTFKLMFFYILHLFDSDFMTFSFLRASCHNAKNFR